MKRKGVVVPEVWENFRQLKEGNLPGPRGLILYRSSCGFLLQDGRILISMYWSC